MLYVNGLLAPVKQLYYDFLEYVRKVNYQIEHNGQVCYLRAALNDSFDNIERRIFITDGNRYDRVYIFTTSETKPKYLGTLYIHQKTDYGDSGVDFIVVVPLETKDLINEYALNAQINFYRLASKRYKVVYE